MAKVAMESHHRAASLSRLIGIEALKSSTTRSRLSFRVGVEHGFRLGLLILQGSISTVFTFPLLFCSKCPLQRLAVVQGVVVDVHHGVDHSLTEAFLVATTGFGTISNARTAALNGQMVVVVITLHAHLRRGHLIGP